MPKKKVMDNNIHFPETVMLIDATVLNHIVMDIKKNFEEILQRPIQDMDVAQFIVNLALDAELPEDNKETQIIFVYDESTPKLSYCIPSDLNKELNGVAFQDGLGEFQFSSLSPEGITSKDELYLDLLHIINESADIKRIIAICSDEDSLSEIHTFIKGIKNKEVTLFSLKEPKDSPSYTWQMLAYPIMQALGIKGEEIQ